MATQRSNATLNTTLIHIAMAGSLELRHVVEADLKQLQILDNDRNTLLFWACATCFNIKIIEAILDKGIYVNCLSSGNWTALMVAASKSRWDIVMFLLRRGADATLLNIHGRHVLFMAGSSNAPPEILTALIYAGADPLVMDNTKKTVSTVARDRGSIAAAEFIDGFYNPPTKSANFVV
jgi:ankyrin repeat protein